MKLHDERIEKLEDTQQEEASHEVLTEAKEEVLTEEMIQAWKAQYGKVFKNVIDGKEFIWRRIKRQEYVRAMGLMAEEGPHMYIRQDAIAKEVVLFPSKETFAILAEEYAGLCGEIADSVIVKSGFISSETEEL